jgi:hypothetical protein
LIAFIIYLLIFSLLIYTNGFFKFFNDEKISRKTFSFLFILKALAVPAFYFLFVKLYGGIEKLDAGKFYSDARTMNNLAYINFPEYLKMLFGFQDDTEGSYFYRMCIEPSFNWDNGEARDFFYNDNRVVIRLHSLLHFISFNSYFVQALFSCFFSFMGLTFLYKTFKEYFGGKELFLLIAISFFPVLWLYSGGLLKEGITIFFLGCSLYRIKQIVNGNITVPGILWMAVLIVISFLLKPYILLYSGIYFSVFLIITRYTRKYKSLIFFSLVFIMAILVNGASVLVKHKSLPEAVIQREKEFSDLAKGGIFLLDSVKFVRLVYNYDLVKKITGEKNYFTIKAGVPFLYWEHSHQKDTLYCKANSDTLTHYSLVYELPTASSNIDLISGSHNFFVIAAKSLYYTLAHPLFYNAKGPIQFLASLENLILLISIAVILLGFLKGTNENYPAIVFLFFALSLFVIIGITTPNIGAILRYRSPAAIFILAAALYSLNGLKKAGS